MKKLLLLSLMFFIGLNIFAQQVEEAPVEEVMEEEDAPVFIDMEVMEESPTPVGSPNYQIDKNKYGTQKIYDGYEWFYLKSTGSYSSKKGILKNGKILLPMIFTASTYSSNRQRHVILALGTSYGIYDLETEKWTVPLVYNNVNYLSKDLYSASKDRRYAIIDANNNAFTKFKWSNISVISGIDNYLFVNDFSSPTKLRGIYNLLTQKMAIPCQYESINKLDNENYFLVTEAKKFNIVDINNKPRFKNWYDELNYTRGGRKHYIVKKDGKYGIIDADEKQIVPIEYLEIARYPYKDGSHLSRNKDGKYGCINIEGKVTLPFVYDKLSVTGYGNTAISTQGGKCGIIQVNSGLPIEIATCDYDDIAKSEKAFVVKKGDKFCVMDLYGKELTGFEYDGIESISNDFLIAEKKSKWYLLNTSGEALNKKTYKEIAIIINKEKPTNYYSRNKFSYLKIQDKNNKYGIIDKFGNEILAPIFDDILSESRNVFLVKKNGKYGLYNLLKKEVIIPYEYDQIVIDKSEYFGIKGNSVYKISFQGKVSKY